MTTKPQEELLTLAKDMQRAYNKEWRRKHPEKVKQHNRDYWIKRAAASQAQRQNIEEE